MQLAKLYWFLDKKRGEKKKKAIKNISGVNVYEINSNVWMMDVLVL